MPIEGIQQPILPGQILVGEKGDKGDTGEKGDKGEQGDPGAGIIAGGTAGQFLKKKSATDYDTEWADEATSTEHTTQFSNMSVSNPSGTFALYKIGKMCVCTLKAEVHSEGKPNTSQPAIVTPLPAGYRPATMFDTWVRTANGGAWRSTTKAKFGTDGTIEFNYVNEAAWTSGTECYIQPFSVTYIIP